MQLFKATYLFFLPVLLVFGSAFSQVDAKKKSSKRKAVFIIVDGIPADVIEKINPPALAEISNRGGFTKAYVGGMRDGYSQTPTISAVGYNSLLTGTWVNKHNVWDNDIKDPNYNYWNIFRIAKQFNPELRTAIFSTWLDNRTKLAGEGLQAAGNITLDYAFDGFEHDTLRFPHDANSLYIHHIDELVAEEAGRYIAEYGPDLSWVYLEYTDDMGHKYGDSDQFYDAIRTADKQVGKIWNAIKKRENANNEEWLIVITTDHGRDAKTGRGHGGQSDRERITWIVTNYREVNEHFRQLPAVVDIMPSICNFMRIAIPEEIKRETDGVPFIGKISAASLQAQKTGDKIMLTWKSMTNGKSEKAEVWIATTNNFKQGGTDSCTKAGRVKVGEEKFTVDVKNNPSAFYKILFRVGDQYLNVWVIDK